MGLYQSVLESSDGGAFVNLRDGSGTNITSTAVSGKQAVDVNIANSMTIGIPDQTTFTYGTTDFLPVGGVFQDTSPTLSAGQSGSFRVTAQRGQHVNLRTSAGVELGNTTGTALFTQDNNSASILSLMQAATGTITVPTVTTASTTALASNAGRKAFSIYNPSIYTVAIAFAATATLSAYTTLIRPNAYYERNSMRVYTGIVTMIGPVGLTGTPNIVVTEETA